MNYLKITLSIFMMLALAEPVLARALFPKSIDYNDYAADPASAQESGSANHRTSYVPPTNGTCEVSCRSSSAAVQVDMTKRCMCVSGTKCFTIDVGYMGPLMTTNGTGTMSADVSGERYRTQPGPGSTSYDGDAIRMGIPANDKHYKWIHKARQCGAEGDPTRGGRNKTAGCIGVPCAYWPLVKAQAGKSLTVCGANQYENSQGKNILPGGKRTRIGTGAN